MWVMLRSGPLSIAKDRGNGCLAVRARRKETLYEFFGNNLDKESRLLKSPGCDYPFRVFSNEREVGQNLSRLAGEINYSNFKASVPDPLISVLYERVWQTLSVLGTGWAMEIKTAKANRTSRKVIPKEKVE